MESGSLDGESRWPVVLVDPEAKNPPMDLGTLAGGARLVLPPMPPPRSEEVPAAAPVAVVQLRAAPELDTRAVAGGAAADYLEVVATVPDSGALQGAVVEDSDDETAEAMALHETHLTTKAGGTVYGIGVDPSGIIEVEPRRSIWAAGAVRVMAEVPDTGSVGSASDDGRPLMLGLERVGTRGAVHAVAQVAESPPVKALYLEDKFTLCELHLLLNRIYLYEVGLYDMIHQLVLLRRATEHERGTLRFLQYIERSSLGAHRWILRKTRMDAQRPRGSGPKPSRLHTIARRHCGSNCARIVTRRVDPMVRTCLCIEYDQYGRSANKRVIKFKSFLVRNAARLALLIDAADIIVDLMLVDRLRNEGHPRYAALMCTAVVIALPIEINVKASLVKLEQDRPPRTGDDSFENFLFFFALTELTIFLLEDATSIFCWYNTRVFEPDDTLSLVNMYLTIVSGIIAGVGLVYPTMIVMWDAVSHEWAQRRRRRNGVQRRRRRVSRCQMIWNWLNFVYYTLLWLMILALLGFWCYVALDIIQNQAMDDQSESFHKAVKACFGLGFGTAFCGLFSFYWNFWHVSE